LTPAIEKKDVRLIRLYLKAMEVEVEGIAERLSRTLRLLERLEELESDDSFVDDLPEIEKLTTELSELERKLNKNYGIGKKLLDEANDALAKPPDDAHEVKEEWAIVEAWLKKHLDIGKQRLKNIEAAKVKAIKAAADRNAKALAEAKETSLELRDAKPTQAELEENLKKFCDKCKLDSLPQDMQDQFARDRESFKKVLDELGDVNSKIAEIHKSIEALELKPIDVKKAAALLKIPSSHESKLQKALELDEPQMIKALDNLSKELKLGKSGKDLAAILKKAKL
jgi:hypothetical protein